MKIDIKNIFEKKGEDVCKHTNERLDIEEVFAEALAGSEPEEPEETEQQEEPEEFEQQEELEEPDQPEESEETEQQEEPEESEQQKEPEEPDQLEKTEPPEESEPLDESEGTDQTEEVRLVNADENGEKSYSDVKAEEPFYKKYGGHAGIAATFVILIAVVIVYATMIPKEVEATINGEDFELVSTANTVERFLEEQDIEFCSDDYISKPLQTFMYDGIELEITHATNFTITADGKTRDYKSLANTVGEALDDVDIKLGSRDIISPSRDTMLTKNMEIVINRVKVREETVEEAVPFETVNKDDVSMDEGTKKVVTEGVAGKDKVTYEVTYVDGKEASRKELSREQITAAVNEVVAHGTRISYNGKSYSRKIVVKAYAYTGGGRTAMGTRARVGEIAVDPSVIPLGTNVYIEGVGARRAEDTGGNIKGNTIDIYMDTQAQCLNWGVRYVTVYIQ